MAAERNSYMPIEQITLTDFGGFGGLDRNLGGMLGSARDASQLRYPLYHDQHRVHYYGSNPPPVYSNGKGELVRRRVDTKPPAARR